MLEPIPAQIRPELVDHIEPVNTVVQGESVALGGLHRLYDDEPSDDQVNPILLEAGITQAGDIRFGQGRRQKIQQHFPEFDGLTDLDMAEILFRWPDLVLAGRGRFDPQRRLEMNLGIFYSWLAGRSTAEIARERGSMHDSLVSNSNRKLLALLRDKFSMDELFSGNLIEVTLSDEEVLEEAIKRLLAVAYPEEDMAVLNFEQSMLVSQALISSIRGDLGKRRIEKLLAGMTDRQICAEEGLKSPYVVSGWRKNLLSTRAKVINFSEILAALNSDDPEAELATLFARIKVGRQPTSRKTTSSPRSSAARQKKKSVAVPVSVPTTERSQESSLDFWAKVKKENEAYRAGPIIECDISEGVDVILLELGISKPEIPQQEPAIAPRRARPHKKTLSLDT